MQAATTRLFSLSNQLIRPLASLTVPRHMSTTTSTSPEADVPALKFSVSPIGKNPLGEDRYIKTAAALVIGDEILNGKTLDRNSNYFARYCFERGIELKRIEVIADDEDEIIEASRRMVEKYDFVVTSGGIGPTHDDITYASLAKAFGQNLTYHAETLARMTQMSAIRKSLQQQTEEQKTARNRMALFPENGEVIFIADDVWVPVVRLEGKLCIFPGIPTLFQKMLEGLAPHLPLPPPDKRPLRMQIFTSLPESSIAPFLTSLSKRVASEGVRVGSYPVLQHGVYVALIGYDKSRIQTLAEEVENELQGKIVSEEEARKMKGAE